MHIAARNVKDFQVGCLVTNVQELHTIPYILHKRACSCFLYDVLMQNCNSLIILLKGAMHCLRSRSSIFVYIRNVFRFYIYGIPYMVYYLRHGHSMRLSCFFQLRFLQLSYPAYCYSWFPLEASK